MKKEINVKESTIEWSGRKIVGPTHKGTLAVSSGSIELEDGKLVSGTVTVDMRSMKSSDLEGETAEKLLGHLRSADFFDVENHPGATFELTSVEDDTATGKLTIKGIANDISFPVKIEGETAHATITLDRTKWDVRYASGKFFKGLGDKTISDEFTVDVKLVLS